MKQSNRLISNVLVTYVRMALTIGIGLATTRLLLEMLGSVDYGLFFVLGGGLSLITLLRQALADAAQRHMAYEIGRGDEFALRQVFATSVLVYLGLGIVMACLGLILRPAFLYGLSIPDERLIAAGWTYDLTLINISLSVFATPFLAVFIARQAMIQDAVFAFLTSVAGLVAVILTPVVHADYLIGYALLTTAVRLVLIVAQVARGLLLFPETRFKPRHINRLRLRELFGFAGWSFVVSFAWQLRVQGAQIILNIFFGPSVNAGYAITMQLANYVQTLSRVVTTASRPVMASAAGGGKTQQIAKLARSISKVNVIVTAVLAIPLIAAPQTALVLWVNHVPPYADSFIPLVIGWNIVATLVSGDNIAVVAHGRLRGFALSYLGVTLVGLTASIAIFAWLPATPAYLPVTSLASQIVLIAVNLAIAKRLLSFSYTDWYTQVLRPLIPAVGLVSLICMGIANISLLPAIYLVFSTTATSCLLLFASWHFVLNGDEKQLITSFVTTLKSRLKSRY